MEHDLKIAMQKLALKAGHRQPTELPRPAAADRPQPTPRIDLEQQFGHLADAVRGLNNSHADTAAKFTIAGAKARGEIPAAKPITAIAQAFMDAADKARKPLPICLKTKPPGRSC